jgi:DNA polymerase-3 subunit alpha
MGLEVLAPSVNAGDVGFVPSDERRIEFGLGAIKGVGTKAVEEIVRLRQEGGAYRDLDDFCDRVSPRVVTQATIETLIKAGAFDCFGARRSQLLAVLPRVLQHGQARQEDRRRGQQSLFDSLASDSVGNGKGNVTDDQLLLPDLPELPDAERLAEEKKALGFYMSAHPLARYESIIAAFSTHEARALAALPDRTEVTVGGMISGVTARNVQKSRSGLTRMVKFTFEDLTGSTPAMLWPEEFAKFESLIRDDAAVFLRGTMNRTREPAELVVSKVIPIEQAAAELSRGVIVTIRKGAHEADILERLARVVRKRQGNLDLYIEIMGVGRVKRALFKAGATHRLRHDERLIDELEAALGRGCVRLLGQRGATSRVEGSQTLPVPITIEAEATLEDSLDE